MSQKPQAVTLTILGKEYKIVCEPNEQDDLLRSAQQLDQQMRKIRDAGKVSGADRIAVMVAINLAHELQLLKTQNALLNESLNRMTHKIENVLEKT
ncbi:Cell division protein ZapA [uncultured bacterium]|nr:Cell division protein ZapA [uncultured bacterium]